MPPSDERYRYFLARGALERFLQPGDLDIPERRVAARHLAEHGEALSPENKARLENELGRDDDLKALYEEQRQVVERRQTSRDANGILPTATPARVEEAGALRTPHRTDPNRDLRTSELAYNPARAPLALRQAIRMDNMRLGNAARIADATGVELFGNALLNGSQSHEATTTIPPMASNGRLRPPGPAIEYCEARSSANPGGSERSSTSQSERAGRRQFDQHDRGRGNGGLGD